MPLWWRMTPDMGLLPWCKKRGIWRRQTATEPVWYPRLSSELRAAEERAREFEADANYFRDRAAHAEEWLVRIHAEVQQTFFQKKEQQQRPVRESK